MPLVEFEGRMTRQGREIDARVAREILGWEVVWRPVGQGSEFLGWYEAWVRDVSYGKVGRRVSYFKLPDLSGCGGFHHVLDHLRERYPRVEIHVLPDVYSVSIEEGDEVTARFIATAEAPTLALALCRAALQLVEEADHE